MDLLRDKQHAKMSRFQKLVNSSHVMTKSVFLSDMRFDTNKAVQPQNMARGLKFRKCVLLDEKNALLSSAVTA